MIFQDILPKISPLIDRCPIFGTLVSQGAYPVFRTDINGYKSGTVFSDNGNVPNIEIHLKDNSAYSFGYMIYFFMRACGMSCYLLGINPFNQPGVEVYKKEMFKLLGKE